VEVFRCWRMRGCGARMEFLAPDRALKVEDATAITLRLWALPETTGSGLQVPCHTAPGLSCRLEDNAIEVGGLGPKR